MTLDLNTVLIVDDEEIIRKILNLRLSKEGFHCLEAANGNAAIEIVKNQPIALVLLDIMMPVKSGLQTLPEIKAINPEMAVIMTTAIDSTDTAITTIRLGAYDYVTKPFNLDDVVIRVKRAADKVKIELENREYKQNLEQMVSERTEQLRLALTKLKSSSQDTILRLSRAAEYKDEDTASHIKRMSRYASLVAEKMGLPPDEVEALLFAAPMHDIGKIGIPDRILLKTGALIPAEWEVMIQHTVIGAQITEGSDPEISRLGTVIALSHHEKWDGSGYPSGIKGENIPLPGRIAAIADVFDALTSRRPYRPTDFSSNEAFRMMADNAGRQFDPAVFAAFQACWEDILFIREKFRDDGKSNFLKMIDQIG